MTRFSSSYKTLRVHRGDNTYIDFHNGEAHVDERDADILRGIDIVAESGAVRPPSPVISAPSVLANDVINWCSPFLGVGDGYGNSAERMIAALELSGQRVSVDAAPIIGETTIKAILDRSSVPGSVRLVYSPPSAQYRRSHYGQALIGFCMWEDTLLPPIWDQWLSGVDVLATPSQFCVDLFRQRMGRLGLTTPVIHVPLGVQTDFFSYQRRVRHPSAPFVFHCSATSAWDERKGIAQIIAAFQEAFAADDNVRLVVRARIGDVETRGDSRIEPRMKITTEAEKRAELYAAHAYVCASKGEGLGLIPLEAIATGLPTICAANTGMLDYIDLAAIPIACDAAPSGIKITGYESTGTWMRPRQAELVDAMLDMVARYKTHVAKAAKSAKAIERWDYAHTAAALREAIEVARRVSHQSR